MKTIQDIMSDTRTPLCIKGHLERAREISRQPGMMMHIRWPSEVVLLSDNKTIQTLCSRNGISFADKDWPRELKRKGPAALVIWTDEKINNLSYIVESKYDSEGILVRRILIRVDKLIRSIKEVDEQVLLFEAEELVKNFYDQAWYNNRQRVYL